VPRKTSRFWIALAETLSSTRMAMMIVNIVADGISSDWGLKALWNLPSFALSRTALAWRHGKQSPV